MVDSDARLEFGEAVAHVNAHGTHAFAAIPVIADDGESVEGLRVYVLQRNSECGVQLRFLAGPFFSAALAADEVWRVDEVPDSVRRLRYIPCTCQEEWFSEQIQVLVARLASGASVPIPQMPDYLSAMRRAAASEVVFPIAMIGRAGDVEGKS